MSCRRRHPYRRPGLFYMTCQTAWPAPFEQHRESRRESGEPTDLGIRDMTSDPLGTGCTVDAPGRTIGSLIA